MFNVACSKESTTVTLNDVGYFGDVANLVYLKPYEYLYGEREVGIAEETSATPIVIGEYDCGTAATFTINRYNEYDYDTVYCKFYLLQGSEILAGPIYPTEIQAAYDHEEVVKVNGIKGIMVDAPYYDEVSKLGCQHTQLNFLASDMIIPLETVDEATGVITPIQYEEYLDGDGKGYITTQINGKTVRQDVESYWHNGKKYYFRAKPTLINGVNHGHVLEYYDKLISRYTRENVKVTLIVLLWLDLDQYAEPYFLTHPAARTNRGSTYSAVNTANPYGAEYWSAFMEFVSRRYSQESTAEEAVYGTVESYIMGNEIDQFSQWNNIVDLNKHEALTMEDYSIEYERMLRISNQALKSAYSRNIPLVPFTQWWTDCGGKNDYKPKEIFDYLSLKTKSEGNYGWGLAIHPYGADLTRPDFWANDVNIVTGSLNTPRITWTNLEVLQLYLEQPIKLYNGQTRDVFVTEGGVSTSSNGTLTDQNKGQQSAGVAYLYYKCSQLPCIKTVNYWRLLDFPVEHAYFGLMTPAGNYKPAYYVWKFIDTQYTWDVSAPYLSYIGWVDNGVSFGTLTPGFDWQMAMRIRPSNFDWDIRWDTSKIIVRETDEIPSF